MLPVSGAEFFGRIACRDRLFLFRTDLAAEDGKMGRCAFRAGAACMDKEQAVGQSMRMVCFGGSRENSTGGKELGFGCLILLESLQRRGERIALRLGLMGRVSGHRRKFPEAGL